MLDTIQGTLFLNLIAFLLKEGEWTLLSVGIRFIDVVTLLFDMADLAINIKSYTAHGNEYNYGMLTGKFVKNSIQACLHGWI